MHLHTEGVERAGVSSCQHLTWWLCLCMHCCKSCIYKTYRPSLQSYTDLAYNS